MCYQKNIKLILIILFKLNNLDHYRNLQENDDKNVQNLKLTAINDQENKNIGYINIDVHKSCQSYQLHVKIKTNSAIRSINGVPLQQYSYQDLLIFEISPFLLKFTQSELDYIQSQEEVVRAIQSNGVVTFIRYISLPLFFFNCLQPISSLMMINTLLPFKPHLLISQFTSFVFPLTPIWMNYNFTNYGQNDYVLPPYTIFGNPVNVEDQNSFSTFQQMGISSSFIVNITETLVLLAINGLVISALKYLDKSQIQSFKDKQYYQKGISFFLNLMEVRLIYILISVFLQFTHVKFSNALNGISAIFAFIFLALYSLFLYLLGKMLNSPNESTDQYRRTHHLIDFLEISKHYLTLNYRYINIFKKNLYFLVLILMYNSPKTVIIILIVISVVAAIFDIIVRPFKINWINNMKMISSISWVGVLISVLISHNQTVDIQSQDYIIEDSTIESYEKVGDAIFYLVWIYFSINSIILLLKLLAVLNILYSYFMERDKRDQEFQLLIKEKQGVDDKEGITRGINFLYNTLTTEQSSKVVIMPNRQVKSDKVVFNIDINHKHVKNKQQQQNKFDNI